MHWVPAADISMNLILSIYMLGHSFAKYCSTKDQKMLLPVTDFDENISAHRANHSEQNDTNLCKIGSAVPKIPEFENWQFL